MEVELPARDVRIDGVLVYVGGYFDMASTYVSSASQKLCGRQHKPSR